jgi:serine/threonine-protein kinase RsbW
MPAATEPTFLSICQLRNEITPSHAVRNSRPMPVTATGTGAAGQTPAAQQPAAEPVTGYQRAYPGRADQVSQVRRDVASHLGGCPVTDDIVLVVSEIASNAIVHSRSRGDFFTIRVRLHDRYCRVECQDAGGAWQPQQHDDRPHGLAIVEALTGPDGWGTTTTSDGDRIVWARLSW